MEIKRFGHTTKAAVLFTVSLFAVNVIIGAVVVIQSRASVKSLINDSMLGIAKTAGAMLDGDELAALTAEDEGGEKQEAVEDKLRVFAENFDFKYIYAVRPSEGGKFIFIADADEKDPAPYGKEVVYSPALGSAGNGKADVDKFPVSDEWGKYYTAYCPVKTSDGRIGGIVGVDFDAEWYEKQMTKNAAYIIFISVFSLAVGGVMVLLVTVRLKNKFDRLNEETMSIASDIGALLDEIHGESDFPQISGESTALSAAEVELSDKIKNESSGIEKLSLEVEEIKINLRQYINYVHVKAYTDGMTGVGNKTAYLELVHNLDNRIVKNDVRFSIAVFDIDALKCANDEYGHEEGDRMITGTANCLKRVFGKKNVFRIGGDEFIAVLEDFFENDMETAFVRLDNEIVRENKSMPEEAKVRVSFSKGAATFEPGRDKAFKEVFRRADKAMYINKDNYYKKHPNPRANGETEFDAL